MWIKQLKMALMAKAGDGGGDGGGGGETEEQKVAREQAAARSAAIARGDEPDATDEEKEAARKAKEEQAALDETETEEEKAEREAAEKAAKEKEDREKRIRIPKSRFDEAQRKAREREAALQAEIERLQKAQGSARQQDTLDKMREKIDELEDKREDLLADGKKEEARKVRREIDALREQINEQRLSAVSTAAQTRALDAARYDAALAGFEAQYPELNPDNEDLFDEDKVNEVSEFVSDFVRAGKTKTEALARAVKAVLGPPKDQSSGAADEARKAREEAARKKAADANRRQAPNTKNIGGASDKGGAGDGKVDVMKLTKDQFSKLDEATLAKLRGDEVEA